MSNAIKEWYHKNNNTIKALLDLACDFIPGCGMTKNMLDLYLARLNDQEENDDFIKETEPTLNTLIIAIREIDQNHQKLSNKALKALIKNNLKEEFKQALESLGQTINKSICSDKSKLLVINRHYKLIKLIGITTLTLIENLFVQPRLHAPAWKRLGVRKYAFPRRALEREKFSI